MSTTETETPIHTLFTREIRPMRNWAEWVLRWQNAEDSQTMESLLHVGFSVSLDRGPWGEKEYDRIDRIVFYLTIADGWEDRFALELPSDGTQSYKIGRDKNWNQVWKTPRDLRHQLARKAFDVLCLNFFKLDLRPGERRDGEFHRDWEEVVTSERLFPAIQNFFLAEKCRFGDDLRLRNLSPREDDRTHNEGLAVTFLLNLAEFIWEWKKPQYIYFPSPDGDKKKAEAEERYDALRARMDEAKPWIVEVLSQLGHLDVLKRRMLTLEDSCIEKLREIASRCKFDEYDSVIREERKVVSIDEACYLGSKSAWFLKELELKRKEHKRLSDIRAAKEEAKRAQEKVKELTSEG